MRGVDKTTHGLWERAPPSKYSPHDRVRDRHLQPRAVGPSHPRVQSFEGGALSHRRRDGSGATLELPRACTEQAGGRSRHLTAPPNWCNVAAPGRERVRPRPRPAQSLAPPPSALAGRPRIEIVDSPYGTKRSLNRNPPC